MFIWEEKWGDVRIRPSSPYFSLVVGTKCVNILGMLAESLLVALGILSFRAPETAAAASARLPLARYVAPLHRAPLRRPSLIAGVATTGKSVVLMDAKSGAVLFSRGGETAYPIASLTKLMTAMIILDAGLPLDEEILLVDADEPSEGRAVLEGGETFTRGELMRALLIGSVNTAGSALARTFPGGQPAFIEAMNKKGQEIGLTSAVFTDPTGLARDNVASAEDVAHMLQRALFYNDIRQITEQSAIEIKSQTGRTFRIPSTNLLLDSFLNKKPYRIIAAKTGSLPEAGFCLAQATQDEKGNELIAVTLGSDNHFSRFQDVKALTAWGFEGFEWR